MGQGKKGAVTVYLTLTLLVVVSLFFVMLESARSAGARFAVDTASGLSADAVLADYNRLLFEQYHIFARDTGSSDTAGKQKFVKEKFEEVFSRNFEADGAYLYKTSSVNVKVKDCVGIADYEGAFFRQQAAKYMEYRGVAFGAETLLEMFGLFTGTGKTQELLEEEAKVTEKLSEIDLLTLKLMQYIDGVKMSADGIKTGITGKVSTAADFVKKLLVGDPSMEAVSIEVKEIYSALESKYEDPYDYLSDMKEQAEKYAVAAKDREELESEILALEREAASLALTESAETAAKRLEIEAKLVALKAELLVVDGELLVYKTVYGSAAKKLKKLATSCREAANSALSVIGAIRVIQINCKPAVQTYMNSLSAAAEWLDSDILSGLIENAEVLQAYVGLGSGTNEHIKNIDGMEQTLKTDRDVLTRLLTRVDTADIAVFSDDTYADFEKIIAEYSFEYLEFDYTGLELKASSFDPFSIITSLLSNGVAGLVLEDASAVSDKEYSGTELPSRLTGLAADEDSGISDSVFELVESSPLAAIAEILKGGASELAEDALYIAYLFDNFSYYGKENEGTKCDYELEYILCGNLTDKANLNGMIMRLLGLRAVMCLMHILSCKEKRLEAEAFATTLLGVTGMPILIKLLQYTLILVWAIEEALVETAALLKGKRVAAVPSKDNFALTFPEIFLLTKDVIMSKAEAVESAAGLDYKSYIVLFLLIQKEGRQNLRTEDVVQENIRLSSDSFRMVRELYGFNYEVEVTVPAVFPAFSQGEAYGYVYSGGRKY